MRDAIKWLLRQAGWSARRLLHDPRHTLLGLPLAPIGTIIDVGANAGQFAIEFSRRFPAAQFVCLEPQEGPFEALETWAQRKPAQRMALRVAAGASAGAAAMLEHVDHSPSSSLLPVTETAKALFPGVRRQRSVEVQVRPLDEILGEVQARRPLPDDWLVKIDVQGFEAAVLAGASGTLRRAKHCLIEVNLDALYVGQPDFRTLAETLYAAGLTYRGNVEQEYGADGHVIYVDALFSRAP